MSRKLKEPYQVIPVGSDWGIKLLTSTNIIERFSTRKAAEQRAGSLMRKNNRPMVIVRTRSGTVKTTDTNDQYFENIERLP